MPAGNIAKGKVKRVSKAQIIFGILMLGYGIFAVGAYFQFEHKAVHVKAKVESVVRETLRGRRGNVAVYRPVVTFSVPGYDAPVTATSTTYSNTFNYQKGSEIEVEYDPESPSTTTRVDTGVSYLDAAIGLFGLLLLLQPLYVKFAGKKKQ